MEGRYGSETLLDRVDPGDGGARGLRGKANTKCLKDSDSGSSRNKISRLVRDKKNGCFMRILLVMEEHRVGVEVRGQGKRGWIQEGLKEAAVGI